MDHLVELALGTEHQLSFGECLEAVFGLARSRSAAGDPVMENRAAVKNSEAAVSLQEQIVEGFRVDDFFPPAADLPEGIPEHEFQERFGGVGGERYRKLTEEIERRIAASAAYRDFVGE